MDTIQQVIFSLRELEQDSGTPKNIRSRISSTIQLLNADGEISLKVSKALQALEEIADDMTVQSDTRTQIFNIVSQLEVV